MWPELLKGAFKRIKREFFLYKIGRMYSGASDVIETEAEDAMVAVFNETITQDELRQNRQAALEKVEGKLVLIRINASREQLALTTRATGTVVNQILLREKKGGTTRNEAQNAINELLQEFDNRIESEIEEIRKKRSAIKPEWLTQNFYLRAAAELDTMEILLQNQPASLPDGIKDVTRSTIILLRAHFQTKTQVYKPENT